MVTQRRVGPLLLVLGAMLALLLARAFQVQVLEHGIWAGEAAAMLQSSEVLPYHRGRILDRSGLELARDEERLELRLCYRDFRRGSAIAQVAHARSSLEMRAVPLPEAEQQLEAWAQELVHFRPSDLYAFAGGAALRAGEVPELARDEAKVALRERRADDLRYYAAELLELEPRLRRCFKPEAESPEAGRSLLDLAARARGLSSAALEQDLARRLGESRTRLSHLAALIERDGQPLAAPGSSPLARLLGLLEGERRDIEEDTADRLFREAAGFDPGRVRTRLLEQRFDTSWIARALRWDDARRHEWIASRRTQWEDSVAEVLLPRMLLRAQEEPIRARRPDRLLSELALLWAPGDEDLRASDGQPRSWREFDEPAVLCELGSLYERSTGARAPAEPRAVLPFQGGGLDQLARVEQDHWRIVGALADLARGAAVEPRVRTRAAGWQPPAGPLDAALRWRRIAAEHKRLDTDAGLTELSWLFFALESRFQDELERQLDLVYEHCGANSPLPFDEARLGRAAEAERSLLRDRSTRPVVVCRQPSWEQIALVTRGAADYDGFRASPTSLRLHPEHDGQGLELAAGLVGSVRRPSLADLLAQSRERVRLSELRNQLARSAEQELELRDLAARLYRNDEWTGGTGVEGWLDRELRGRNGYQESFSMAGEVQAAGSELTRAPIDGADVVLTLDAGLQRAAQDVLAHPVMPNGDESDQLWCQYPVGAIVLLTPEGDTLVAASAPGKNGLAPTPGRDDEHSYLRERTLQRPTANPPGSCFKPFVAAYALERLKLERSQVFGCLELKGGGKGYATMHCHGHGMIGLREALVESCNAYFGQLAEACYKPEDFVAMAHVFGFGEPTGLSALNTSRRALLREDFLIPEEERLRGRAQGPRHADAFRLRAVSDGGDADAGRARDRGTRERHAARSAPGAVDRRGRAAAALAVAGDLREQSALRARGARGRRARTRRYGAHQRAVRGAAGLQLRLQDGQRRRAQVRGHARADARRPRRHAGRQVRKHTWIAGWFPAEKPRGILVVYLHDVSETATRSSVYIAAQFLQQEAVRRFACGEEPKR